LPTITLEVVLRRDSIQEFPRIIEQAAEFGVDRVKGYHLFAFHRELTPLSLVHYKELYNQIYLECHQLAHRVGMSLLMAEPFMLVPQNISATPHPCPYLWRKMWVDFNGDVLACISHPLRNVVGNIFKDPLEAIWNSPAYQALRRGEDPMCRRCGYRIEVPAHQPLPYDDNYLTHTGAILRAYQLGEDVVEQPVGLDWPYLWCRRTAQMPLPSEWAHLTDW
jgi:MoaA/NifB/PqqE/SkfB family radical SAM enzyme